MISYLAKLKKLSAKLRGFEVFEVELIPRDQNTRADTLSKLMSSSLSELNRYVYLKVHHHRNGSWSA
ncbi:hypothetical protein RDABS01_009789 [Bienertia sinuspersici]